MLALERAYGDGMKRTPVRTVVLARDLAAFHDWCRETGHSPRDRSILFASGPSRLRGLGDAELVRYGDWWNRLDGRALREAVAALRLEALTPTS